MLLGDPAGQGWADRARGNVDRVRGENSRQPFGPERDVCKRVESAQLEVQRLYDRWEQLEAKQK